MSDLEGPWRSIDPFVYGVEIVREVLPKITAIVIPVVASLTQTLGVVEVVFTLLCANLAVQYLERWCSRPVRSLASEWRSPPQESEASWRLALALARPVSAGPASETRKVYAIGAEEN